MELPREPREPKLDISGLVTLITAPTKFGKSTLAAQFPNALFLDTEGGLSALRCHQLPVRDWKEVREACGLIAAGNHAFETIIIDTVTQFHKMCTAFVCEQLGIAHESDLEFGKAYSRIANEMQRVITKMAFLPYGLVLIGHEKPITRKDGSFMRWALDLSPTISRNLLAKVDLHLHGEIEEEIVEGEIVERRYLYTKPTSRFDAGDRTGRLPLKIPFGWTYLEAALKAADVSTDRLALALPTTRDAIAIETETSEPAAQVAI